MTFDRPYWIMASQYFLYFGVLGIFLPYFNLYCHHLGFGGFEIGVLSGLRSMTLVVFSIAWSILADHFQARRRIYILCNLISVAVWLGYLFTTEFRVMFWITLIYGLFFGPIIAFMEAFTIDLLKDQKERYGQIRAWGTIAFIVVVAGLGRLTDFYPIRIILLFVFAGSLCQALLALGVPGAVSTRRIRFRDGAAHLKNRGTAVVLCAGFLMLASHGTYYGLFSIHLEALGYSRTFIGFAWALASVAEILVMIRSRQIFGEAPLKPLLVMACIVAALRWIILSAFGSPIAVISAQLLHAATYACFHIASILYIDRQFPEGAKTLGQAVNNAVGYGLGMMIGFLVNGVLYERVGAERLFLVSAGIALSAAMLLEWGLPSTRNATRPTL